MDCPQERDGKRGAGKGETGTFPASPCTSGGAGWGGCLQREEVGLKGEARWLADSGCLSGKKGWSHYPRGLANVWPYL